jgi:hypothetical protein
MTELRDLERLAPTVDVELAATQFRRTIGSRRRHRRFVTTSIVVLVAASLVGVALAARDDSTPVVAGPGPTVPVPACADLERFAQTMAPSRFVTSIEGTSSPAELATQVDVVLAGTLTGGLVDEEYPSEGPGVVGIVGYDVEVTKIAKGATLLGSDKNVTVWDPQISPVDPEVIRQRIPVGAPVIVLARVTDQRPGGRIETSEEGFMTGCPDGPPLGAVGTHGTWPTFTTFESLRAALGLDQPKTTVVGESRRLTLYTHCGLSSVVVDGTLWLATPPITDVPRPTGWGFNFTPGVFVVLDADSARFDADSGVTAHFRRAAPGEPDPAGGCR